MRQIVITVALCRRPFCLLLIGCLTLVSSQVVSDSTSPDASPLVIRYPQLGEEYGQTYSDYCLELLRLALKKSGTDYRLEPITLSNFRESRSVMSVAKGLYDIHWMNTNPTRESVLRPIRIPLYKGLIGWRLLMVRGEDENRFSGMTTIDPLRQLKTVQGHDWPDSKVLQSNNLKVVQTPHWEGMFKMLYAGRVDYFPRSVIEVWKEQGVFADLSLAVDPHVVLVYPSAYYFFVRKDNTALADAVEKGLRIALEDGSFDRVLMAHFGDSLKRAKLDERTIIRLENPLMTPQTPLDSPELWYQP